MQGALDKSCKTVYLINVTISRDIKESMMHPVEISHIVKSFGTTKAVADVSFEVRQGEIFGLLGPNGAGKTTTIRMMLDIFEPESGTISVLGGPMTDEKKSRIGYMPEERGLYQDVTLERCLLYLASLKEVPEKEVHQRLEKYLERFDLTAHKGKKVKELSKGMQQKAQIIATLLHQPELIVIDEPFSALDPLNVQLVKDLMQELRQQGVTIIMSTHQMHQVEELCDRILLIDKGHDVLYGNLSEIRRRFSGHAVLVRTEGELPKLSGVKNIAPHNDAVRLNLTDDVTPKDILLQLTARDITLEKFEIAIPSLDEIFIRVVRDGGLPT
jgi:ABC-2 type transport system ATP-binding protein